MLTLDKHGPISAGTHNTGGLKFDIKTPLLVPAKGARHTALSIL